ncbi:MAG TPA: GNAT family N-acetyltransferase [Pseudonocardia sp.]|nr:GNAT family N-acetyltransferase [Pseudonocardia sp.]
MPWRFSADVRPYAAQVWDLLVARPAANTVALTTIDHVRSGRRWSDRDSLFGWFADERGVSGAVSMTPPYELLLAEVPEPTMPALVDALRAAEVPVPGTVGVAAAVDRFAALWTASTGLRIQPGMRQRLYRLGTLRAPSPPPPGRAELAARADVVLVANWYAAFQREVGTMPVDVEPIASDAVEQGMVWLWRTPAGAPVALAAHTRVVAGVSRVGPVYVPPVGRRRGHGAAVTAACTEGARRAGATDVVLFTDLANPTPNEVYQRIGYLPQHDHQMVRFVPT